MYPENELTRLAVRKTATRLRIRSRRAEIALLAAQVTKPIGLMEAASIKIRMALPLAGLAAIPFGILVRRLVMARMRGVSTVLRWTSNTLLAVRAARLFMGAARRG